MNEEQIYCKTPEGERALLQRTRLVQRNLRNVLILVDGATDVAELTRKLGDGGFLRASLAELVRGGFIETLEESRVRRGLEAANAPEGEPKTIPVPEPELARPVQLPPQVDSVLPEHSGWRVEPKIDLTELEEDEEVRPETESAPAEPAVTSGAQPFWKRWFARKVEPRAEAAEPVSPPPAEAAPALPHEPKPPKKVRIKKIRRGPAAEPVNWTRRVAVSLLVLLVVAALGVLLFPYDRYRDEVARRASAWIGQPVSIGGIRLALSASPAIVLDQVRIGDQPGVVVGAVRVVPNPLSLSEPTWKLGSVVLDRPLIDHAAILALLGERRAPSAQALRLQRVRIDGATVSVGGITLDGVSGDILLSAEAELTEIRLDANNGALRLTAVPEGKSALKVTLTGNGLRVPLGGGVPVDSVDAQGTLTRNGLRADKIELRTLDGTVSGSAGVEWGNRVDLSIQARYARIGLKKLLALAVPAARVEGEASGRLGLRGNGDAFLKALGGLAGSGTFTVERGVFSGFDLVEAVRSSRSETPIRGGDTKLESLEGNISFDGGNWQLTGMRGHSGALSTYGHLRQAGSRIDGGMDVQLRGSANQVNVPVSISGTMADPVLKGRRGGPAPAAEGQGTEAAPAQ